MLQPSLLFKVHYWEQILGTALRDATECVSCHQYGRTSPLDTLWFPKMMTNTLCSVAKTKVGLVCPRKSAVLRYQSGGENKNHNRMWVRVTERNWMREREREIWVCELYQRWREFPFRKKSYWYQTHLKFLMDAYGNAFLLSSFHSMLCCSLSYGYLHFTHLSPCPSHSPSHSSSVY